MNFVYMSEPLQQAHSWQTLEGDGVVLFYLPGEADNLKTVQDKVSIFDWALQENYCVFQVEPLWFKVHVFLFPDAVSHAAALDYEEPLPGGAAQIHSITLAEPLSLEDISCLAVHELAHVITMNLFGCDIPGFLMEGMAVYAQNAVPKTAFVSFGWDPPDVTMEEPLTALMETTEFDYSHAGGFVGYLIKQETERLDKLTALCRLIELLHWLPLHTRVVRAMQAIYEHSLEEMETAWRLDSPTVASY